MAIKIYIDNIVLPDSCSECRFSCYIVGSNYGKEDILECTALQKEYKMKYETYEIKRHRFCPLKMEVE